MNRCAIDGRPATYHEMRPGTLTACDEHVDLIKQYNEVQGEVQRLTYRRKPVPKAMLQRLNALHAQIVDLRTGWLLDD